MKFEIRNHLLYRDGVQVPNRKTVRKSSGSLPKNPDLVMHYTVGENFDSMVNALTLPGAGGGAAHLVIGREGEVTQIETFKHRLWHAGSSYWKGRKSLNYNAIGIEICNQGWLNERRVDGSWRQNVRYKGGSYKTRWHEPDEVLVARHPNKAVYVPTMGVGAKQNVPGWAKYTKAQREVLEALTPVIVDYYDVREVVSHDDVSPGRKQDVGPDMLEDVRRWNLLTRSGEDDELILDKPVIPVKPGITTLPVLGKGDEGVWVKRLQAKLIDLGIKSVGKADGIFGPKTDAAVRLFQKTKGLIVDGYVGPNTWSKLK